MKPGAFLATLVLTVVAFGHLLRLIFGVAVTVGGFTVPVWFSAPGFLIAAAIVVLLWRENRPLNPSRD